MKPASSQGIFSPVLLGVAGAVSFIGSSSAWIRMSFIQIRGLDYWFGFITAISACVILITGVVNSREGLISQKWQKNWLIFSTISSILSITTLVSVATRVEKIGEEISKKAELQESFVGGQLLGVLGRVIAKATNSFAEFIKPKLAEGFYITLASFIVATLISLLLITRNRKKPPSALT